LWKAKMFLARFRGRTEFGLRIADCGLRNGGNQAQEVELKRPPRLEWASDCGLRTADLALRALA
jgi:hypothetical protein